MREKDARDTCVRIIITCGNGARNVYRKLVSWRRRDTLNILSATRRHTDSDGLRGKTERRKNRKLVWTGARVRVRRPSRTCRVAVLRLQVYYGRPSCPNGLNASVCTHTHTHTPLRRACRRNPAPALHNAPPVIDRHRRSLSLLPIGRPITTTQVTSYLLLVRLFFHLLSSAHKRA